MIVPAAALSEEDRDEISSRPALPLACGGVLAVVPAGMLAMLAKAHTEASCTSTAITRTRRQTDLQALPRPLRRIEWVVC